MIYYLGKVYADLGLINFNINLTCWSIEFYLMVNFLIGVGIFRISLKRIKGKIYCLFLSGKKRPFYQSFTTLLNQNIAFNPKNGSKQFFKKTRNFIETPLETYIGNNFSNFILLYPRIFYIIKVSIFCIE